MAHQVETMAYVGRTPWHGLGRYVGDTAVDADTMLKEAGLDWSVSLRPLYITSQITGSRLEVTTNKAVTRDTDERVLGVVGNGYRALQNKDAFQMLDDLCGDGSMRYHTAGSLSDGAHVWALGKIGSVEVVPQDKIDQYLLIYTSHDGSKATRVIWTDVRVVCANTAAAALSAGRGQGISIRHTRNQLSRINEARRVLGIAQQTFEKSTEFYKAASKARLTEERWIKMAGALFPDPKEGSNARAAQKREDMTRLLFRGRGQNIPGVSGTLYAARNAVVEYCNYERQSQGTNGEKQAKRFESTIWGSSAKTVERCDEIIAEMLKVKDLEPASIDAVDLMSSL